MLRWILVKGRIHGQPLGYSFLLGGNTSHRSINHQLVFAPTYFLHQHLYSQISLILSFYSILSFLHMGENGFSKTNNHITSGLCPLKLVKLGATLLLEAFTSYLFILLKLVATALQKHVPHHTSSSSSRSRCNMQRKLVFHQSLYSS